MKTGSIPVLASTFLLQQEPANPAPSTAYPVLGSGCGPKDGSRCRPVAGCREVFRPTFPIAGGLGSDSRATARMIRVGAGYDVRVAVDVPYKLIVEQEVQGQVVDRGPLVVPATVAKETLGVVAIQAVADRSS